MRKNGTLDAERKTGTEYELIDRLASWFGEVGWKVMREARLDPAQKSRTDLIVDTGKGLVLVDAKKRGSGEPGRVALETYPAGYRIFLSEQGDGSWRIRTESRTYDPRPLSSDTVKQLLEEMLG